MFPRTLTLLLLLTASACAGLKWDKPLQQFDRSPADGHLEAHFIFRNTGPAPVTIKSLRSSCGCTTTELKKKTYAPGEQGEVVARFVFGDRKGVHHKTVTVETDEKSAGPVVLDLRVDIHEPLTIAPALVWWRKGEADAAKSIQITAETARPVRVKSIASSNPRLTASLQTVKAGEQYVISVKPADTARKETAEIRVQTDFPPDAPRAYTVHARIK